jgi:hypothetical protein
MRISIVLCITLACLPGCTPEDIFVAKAAITDAGDDTKPDSTVPPGNDASTVPSDCSSNDDCEPRQYCAKSECDDAQGGCLSRPALCDPGPHPVCGCDGVNYFNDCLRRANGVAAATEGECDDSAILCGLSQSDPCPNDGYCAKFPSGPYCLPGVPGHCWVLPAECGEADGEGERFVLCDDGLGGDSGACVDACRAIRSERPYSKVEQCPP